MSFCQKCGANVQEGSAFCTECGAPINNVQSNAQATNQTAGQNVNEAAGRMQNPERYKAASPKTSQPNPIEEGVRKLIEKIASGASVKTAMIIAIICQILDIIYCGYQFHFSGFLEELTDMFVENVPLWVWLTIYELSALYVMCHIIKACYNIGMKSWLLYVTPLIWVAALALFDIAVLTDMGVDDLKWVVRMMAVTYVFVGIIGYQLISTRFSWLGKVTIVTAVCWLINGIAEESMIPSLLCILSTIYWAIVANNEISKYNDEQEQAFYDQYTPEQTC